MSTSRFLSVSKTFLSLSLALALTASSPGLGFYEAAAQVLNGAASGRALPVAPIGAVALPAFAVPGGALDLDLATGLDLDLNLNLDLGMSPALAAPAAELAAPALQAETLPMKEVAKAIAPLKAPSGVAPGTAHAAGARLERIMTRTRSAEGGVLALEAAPALSALAANRMADRDSGDKGDIPMPSPVEGTVKGGSDAVQAPLPARIFAALVAAAPVALIAAPLLLAGSTLAAGAVTLAALSVMAMPFFGPKTSKLVRTAPGAAVLALGAFAAFSAFSAGGSAVLAALTVLGGWGLVRFGKSKDEKFYDQEKILGAFFGAIGAVAAGGFAIGGAAAALAPLAAFLPFLAAPLAAGVAAWGSGLLASLLLMHLPGWIGEGIESVVRGLWHSGRGVLRTLMSVKRDTHLRRRLSRWSEKAMERSVWNFWKVGALWLPVWIVEGVSFAAGAVLGVALGALSAPVNFFWGSLHSVKKDLWLTKFFAEWSNFVFRNTQASKKKFYNPAALPLVKLTDSKSFLARAFGGAALKVLQVVWALGIAVATVPLHVIGFLRAFAKAGAPYDADLHSPNAQDIDRDDAVMELPELPKNDDPGRDLLPPALFASALVALPAWFLAAPLWGSLAGYALGGLLGVLAAMPLYPKSTPKAVRSLAGWGLIAFGAAAMLGAPLVSWTAGLGLVAALGGWGFNNYLRKAYEGRAKDRWVDSDDPEYIGAYFGVFGTVSALGISLLGLSGWLPLTLTVIGALSSGLLLMHLPKAIWTGVGVAFEGVGKGIDGFWKHFHFWTKTKNTKFYQNMKKQADYFLDGSVWKIAANATWLSLIWVPTWFVRVVESVLALGLGLAFGLAKAPVNWAWGALYEAAPNARLTRFFAGLGRSLHLNMEGEAGQRRFLRWTSGLREAMNASKAPSGRPTLKAALAFLGARVVQIGWLLTLTVGAPWFLLKGLVDGVKNAAGEKAAPGKDDEYRPDLDDPDATF